MGIQEQTAIKEEYYNEAMRYMANAVETIKKAGKDGRQYVDEKYVKTACGTAYNGVRKALDGYFILKGVERKKGRKSIEWYEINAAKIDRKLNTEVKNVYEILHLSGYYDGLTNVKAIEAGFEVANAIIERIKP
jgi:hypothetical protein